MSKIIPFRESDGSHEDPRPLPFIVAEMYNFPLQSHDMNDGVFYSVLDWMAGIATTDNISASKMWSNMQNQTSISTRSLKYQAADGKEYERDFATDRGLYEIAANMRVTRTRPALKAIKVYLAEAGVFADIARREPETVEGMLSEQRRKKYLRDGREDIWITIREMGVSTRKQIMALVKYLLGTGESDAIYSILTNDTYRGLFDKSAAEIREHLGIPKGANLREFMNVVGLSFILQAEAMITVELQAYSPDDRVSEADIRKVFIVLSKMVGKHVRDTEATLGRDVITGHRFLPDGEDDNTA